MVRLLVFMREPHSSFRAACNRRIFVAEVEFLSGSRTDGDDALHRGCGTQRTGQTRRTWPRSDIISRCWAILVAVHEVTAMRPLVAVLAIVGVLLSVQSPGAAEDKQKARVAYRLATQHYDLGEYKEALTAFKDAYRNFEDPAFLFNIAQCHRQLGDTVLAVREYRAYLRKVPDASNRDEVRADHQAREGGR